MVQKRKKQRLPILIPVKILVHFFLDFFSVWIAFGTSHFKSSSTIMYNQTKIKSIGRKKQ